MYGKVFEQIYKSTITECWEALVTFQQFIVLADCDGIVDETPSSISRTTNIPLEIIEKGIAKLEEPDPQSRSPVEGGRRIVRLDNHRDWGWRLVNHGYYRGLKSREDKREADRVRMAEKRKKDKEINGVADSRNESRPVAEVAYADTDTKAEAIISPNGDMGKPKGSPGNSLISQAEEVLVFLNTKFGRNWSARTPNGKPTANGLLVMARLKDGYTADQLRMVAMRKHGDWHGDDNMSKYLRPETLFGKTKFSTYLGECVTDG